MPLSRKEQRVLAAVGGALRTYRLEAGLTQEALAHQVDVHPTYLSGIENGKRNPSFMLIDRLLKAVGRTWGDLAHDVD